MTSVSFSYAGSHPFIFLTVPLDLPIMGSLRLISHEENWNMQSLKNTGRSYKVKVLSVPQEIQALSGEVEHLSHNRFILTQEEKSQGLILACRAIPKSNVEVSSLLEARTDVAPTRFIAQVSQKGQLTHDTSHLVLRSVDGIKFNF